MNTSIATHNSYSDQHISPEWLTYCPKDYYIKYPHKKSLDQKQSLTYIANAIAHMDQRDQCNIDERIFLATIHLTPSIHNIHRKIIASQRAINRSLINHFKYGSIDRRDKIGIINALDYEGSRVGMIDLTTSPSPHLHLILIFPKELYSHLKPEEIPQEICKAIIDSKFVKPYELNEKGDVISRGIHVAPYQPDHPLWYVTDYYTKYSKSQKEHSSKPSSLVISPRDEIINKWRDQPKKISNFLLGANEIINDFLNSPEKHFSCSPAIDWTGESSDTPEVTEPSDPVIIPRSESTSISSIDRIIDEYISSCMNCSVRGLELPLSTKRIELLLKWEFEKFGGRENWLLAQERRGYWLDHWKEFYGV